METDDAYYNNTWHAGRNHSDVNTGEIFSQAAKEMVGGDLFESESASIVEWSLRGGGLRLPPVAVP
eukprot:16859-Prorocentrum_minimum.AAC.2